MFLCRRRERNLVCGLFFLLLILLLLPLLFRCYLVSLFFECLYPFFLLFFLLSLSLSLSLTLSRSLFFHFLFHSLSHSCNSHWVKVKGKEEASTWVTWLLLMQARIESGFCLCSRLASAKSGSCQLQEKKKREGERTSLLLCSILSLSLRFGSLFSRTHFPDFNSSSSSSSGGKNAMRGSEQQQEAKSLLSLSRSVCASATASMGEQTQADWSEFSLSLFPSSCYWLLCFWCFYIHRTQNGHSHNWACALEPTHTHPTFLMFQLTSERERERDHCSTLLLHPCVYCSESHLQRQLWPIWATWISLSLSFALKLGRFFDCLLKVRLPSRTHIQSIKIHRCT